MNPAIETMFTSAEGRYLEATEQAELTKFASTLEQRLEAMREIEKHESDIIEATVDELMKEHPELMERHLNAREKGIRDMTLVLRYSAMAMVRDSDVFLTNKLLHWFRTIIAAFEMSDALDFAYSNLIEQTGSRLSAKHFGMIEPYLKLVHATLTK